MEALINLDGNMLLWIQEHLRVGWLNPVMIGITTLGNIGLVWIVISIGLVICKKTRKTGIICLIALLLSLVINNMLLKNLVARPRPFSTLQSLTPLISLPKDYSFPSGHTAVSFSCAGVLFRKLSKKYGIAALILAILIAWSRLYVGVHYPSDVIVGILSGIEISYMAEVIFGGITAKCRARGRKGHQV